MPIIIDAKSSKNFYIGFAEETTPGTPVAPSIFPRWKTGTKVETEDEFEEVKEGDSTRRASFVLKNGTKMKITYKGYLRPSELGYFLKWALGSGAETFTTATVATTLSADTTAGATNMTVAANTGLTGSGTIPLVINPGGSDEEIAIFTIPATGSGPYTLAVHSSYNGGALRLAHTSGVAVRALSTHAMTDQTAGIYVTIEAGFANLFSAGGTAVRIASCMMASFKISGEKGKLIEFEAVFTGIASTIQATPATVTLEQHQAYIFTHGVWTIDDSTSGDAPNLTKFELTVDNGLDDDTQTEALILSCLLFGELMVKVAYSAILTSFSKIRRTHFGSDTGTTDSQLTGTGNLDVTFTQADTLNSMRLKILTIAYTKAPWPEPSEDGKHYVLDVEGTSVAAPIIGSGTNNAYLLQATLTNTKNSAY